jgi:hypothetical protein
MLISGCLLFLNMVVCCFLTCRGVFLLFSASWWRLYGTETPALQRMATRILSLASSASGCERNWSGFEGVSTFLLCTFQQQ